MTATATDPRAARAESAGTPRIVVGVDGSEQSLHALRWAIERARLSGEVVEPVYIFDSAPPVDFSGYAGPIPMTSAEELAEAAATRLTQAVQRADDGAPGVVVKLQVVDDHSRSAALVREAAGAAMLVLGVHRRHWMDGAIGSTARACLKHAPCAVVVVPEPVHGFDHAGESENGHAT